MTSVLPTRLSDVNSAIATTGLTKRYGRRTALRHLDLQVPSGSVYLLVGPNGAGKSTTLKILLQLVTADEGTATVLDMRLPEHAPLVRANIGYVPEQHDWGYGWMRVGRLLEHHSRYFPTWDSQYAARLTRTFDLPLDQAISRVSKGQARRVHLTMALAHRPPLLLLDEPIDGLDPLMRDETLGILAEHLAESPTTVLLSTHHVEEVESLADHIGVLRSGELRAQMTIADLRSGLRRYRAEVPDGWTGIDTLNKAALRRSATAREVQWTVWGTESEVVRQLTQSGATVREAAPIGLHEATLALLTPTDDD